MICNYKRNDIHPEDSEENQSFNKVRNLDRSLGTNIE